MDVISTAVEFIEKIRAEDIVTIKFVKKNGTDRLMKCTLNFDRIPDADKPKGVSLKKILDLIKNHNHIHVYDLEKNEWRTVPFNSAEWLTTSDNRMFKIKR